MVLDIIPQTTVEYDEPLDETLSELEVLSLGALIDKYSPDELRDIGMDSLSTDEADLFDGFRRHGRDAMSGSCDFTHLDKLKARAKVRAHFDSLVETSKEPIAKTLLAEARAEAIKAKVARCHEHVLFGSCPNGHRYAKELYSGFEFCPICGKDGSPAHGRRIARWFPKVQQVESMAYIVVEHSLKNRDKYRTREQLEASGRLVTFVLSGNYEVKQRRAGGELLRQGDVARIKAKWFARGLRRKHYFGDIPVAGCASQVPPLVMLPSGIPAASQKSNIHDNVLADGGYLTGGRLKRIQGFLREAFCEPDLIVHYEYTREPARKWHWLAYVTRATFLDIDWDKHLAAELDGFRNMHSWGKWADLATHPEAAKWSLDDLAGEDKTEADGLNIVAINKLAKSICPKDGLRIVWQKPRQITELCAEQASGGTINFGGGYHELRSIKPCGHVLDSPEVADRREVERVKAKSRRQNVRYEYFEAYHSMCVVNENGSLVEVLDTGSEQDAVNFCMGKHIGLDSGGGGLYAS